MSESPTFIVRAVVTEASFHTVDMEHVYADIVSDEMMKSEYKVSVTN